MEHIEISFPGGLLTTNEEINRVQIVFDDAPDEAIRAKLKVHGFRWAPSEVADAADAGGPGPRKVAARYYRGRGKLNAYREIEV